LRRKVGRGRPSEDQPPRSGIGGDSVDFAAGLNRRYEHPLPSARRGSHALRGFGDVRNSKMGTRDGHAANGQMTAAADLNRIRNRCRDELAAVEPWGGHDTVCESAEAKTSRARQEAGTVSGNRFFHPLPHGRGSSFSTDSKPGFQSASCTRAVGGHTALSRWSSAFRLPIVRSRIVWRTTGQAKA